MDRSKYITSILSSAAPRLGARKPVDRHSAELERTPDRLIHARATGAPAFAFDRRLSIEARGMLAYMLATRPERSPAKADALFAECGIGSHKGYRILQELRDAAYVVLRREREQGRVVAGEWEIAPEPRLETSGGRFDANR